MDPAQTPAAIEFGRFRVLPQRRELLAEGRPAELGGRAFDVLMALIEASGAVVSTNALMNRVWPDRIVEENNLHAQISALRRAFGADRDLIRTIAGRGYQFTGEIRTVAATSNAQTSAGMAQAASMPSRPPTNLPEPVSELIGRDAELDEILGLTAAHRLVTLTGAGGIGKTRLGFAAARHLLPRFADGVWADRGGDCAFRAHRRTLGDIRVAAHQGRASSIGGCTECGRRSRGPLPAGARLDAPARRSVLGTARGHQPGSTAMRDQGRSSEANALLQPVYDRFTEGFNTADLKDAKALLDTLH